MSTYNGGKKFALKIIIDVDHRKHAHCINSCGWSGRRWELNEGRCPNCNSVINFESPDPSKAIEECFPVQTVQWTIEAKNWVTMARPGRGIVRELVSNEYTFASGTRERDFRSINSDLIFS